MDNTHIKFNNIKKCEIKKSKQLFPHNFNNLNNLKSAKYFSIPNSENQIKKALTKYRENYNKKINNINNLANKTASTSDISKIFSQKKMKNKNKSFKIDKEILSYAEPRTKIKQFYKIQPKVLDSYISENSINLENFLLNDEETIINEADDITNSELEIIENFSGINKFKNYNENSSTNININSLEKEYFLTEIDEKNNLGQILNINDINLEYLIMIEKLYEELIKDIEINKMDIYQNKLAIIKDLLYIYNNQSNYNLYNIIDNILFDNEDLLLFDTKNNTYNNKHQNNNNSKYLNYNIFIIIKEFIIIQIIFFYTLILISLIKKEKNIFQSGIHSISFYFHQNIIIFIYIIFSYFNTNNTNDENCNKCIKILNENKTWLDKNNYKKYIKTNNNLSKQIILNLLKQIKANINNNINNKIIGYIINILNIHLISYNKRKIINILQELKSNSSINDLLQKLNFHKIISHFIENNNILNETNNSLMSIEEPPKPPYLLPISPKYQYTLVLDLDETLVHYVSDDDSAYIQIRPGAEEFIKELSDFYEIIIFTAALQNYADLIISGLDPDGVVSYKLYRQHTINVGNSYIKDLEKLGRDIKKIIIIDNISENFSQQPKNGLNIDDFEGNEYDEELKYLKEDLIKLVKLKPDDVRYYLKDIQKKMDKRATYFKNLNDRANNEENEFYDNNSLEDIT